MKSVEFSRGMRSCVMRLHPYYLFREMYIVISGSILLGVACCIVSESILSF